MAVNFILIFVVLFIVLGVIGLVIVLTRSRKRKGPLDVAVCGQCNYNVRGLTTFNCPECGSDLREVGIISHRSSPPQKNLIWQIPLIVVSSGLIVFAAFGFDMSAVLLIVLVAVVSGGIIGAVHWNKRHDKQRADAANTNTRSKSRLADPSPKPTDNATQRTSAVLTIMFIDMQDYSAQTATQSRLALAELIQKLRDVVEPYARRRNGRIVKSLGDGLLLTFASPTEALLGGAEIQADAKAADLPPLRIGVSTGEVSVFTDDVLGEPVNVASRIENMAEPGRVYFSEATFHAMTRSEVPHEEAGEFELKGLDGMRKVYRVTG